MATYLCEGCGTFRVEDDEAGITAMHAHLRDCQPRDIEAEARARAKLAALEARKREVADARIEDLMRRLRRD